MTFIVLITIYQSRK